MFFIQASSLQNMYFLFNIDNSDAYTIYRHLTALPVLNSLVCTCSLCRGSKGKWAVGTIY